MMPKNPNAKKRIMKKPKKNFFSRLMNFVQYHNAFSIGFMIVFVGISVSFAASPDLRESLISSQDSVRSVDNSYISTVNLNNLNFDLQIKEIIEDGKNYYIVYGYKTIDIQDYVWQDVQKQNTMTVSKEALGDEDLGLYVAEELGEVIDYELSYLKQAQTIEKEKGVTQKIIATQYAGLIGKLLNPQEKVFPGYTPVVPQGELAASGSEIAGEFTPSQSAQQTSENGTESGQQAVQAPVDRELIRQIVQEILAQEQVAEATSTATTTPPIEEVQTETPGASAPSESVIEAAATTTENATSTEEAATTTELVPALNEEIPTSTEEIITPPDIPVEVGTTTDTTTEEISAPTEETATTTESVVSAETPPSAENTVPTETATTTEQ